MNTWGGNGDERLLKTGQKDEKAGLAHSRPNAPTAVFGKLSRSFFLLVFLGLGLFFARSITRDAVAGIRIGKWKETPCEIISSRVGQTNEAGDFRLEVQYRYTFGGQTFISDQYQRNPTTFADYGKAVRQAGKYQPGSSAVCYVNPAAPAEAVLDRESLHSWLSVLFPMIFVIGVGAFFFPWRRKSAAQESAQPISGRAGGTKGRWTGFAFSLVFILLGVGFFYGFFLRPLLKILDSRQWPVVPCVVISSEVRSNSGDEGTTYSVNILYSYQFQDREFKANAYDFTGGSSTGYRGKAAIVSRHPPGTKTVCYVNPGNPTEAVLERSFTPGMWLGLIPLVFVLMGTGGLNFILRKRRHDTLTGTVGARPEAAAAATIVLKPSAVRWSRWRPIICWNVILLVIAVLAIGNWQLGQAESRLTVIKVLFVAIVLGQVAAAFYFVLVLLNPRPRLMVTPGAVRLGGALRVDWEIIGRLERLQNLRIRLQGLEETSYRRGTSTCKDSSVFALVEIANLTAAPEMRSGSRTVTIPANLMHSFASANNKILWSIQVREKIARRPNLMEEFPLTVLPATPTTPQPS